MPETYLAPQPKIDQRLKAEAVRQIDRFVWPVREIARRNTGIVKLYLAGSSSEDIGRRHRMSRQNAMRIIRRFLDHIGRGKGYRGLSRNGDKAEFSRVMSMHRRGLNFADIARRTGRTRKFIYQLRQKFQGS
jgi:hypothetical protein